MPSLRRRILTSSKRLLAGRIDIQNLVGACALGEKTNKYKTQKHFSDGPGGTIVPGTNWDPSQGQMGQSGGLTVEWNRQRPVCPRDGSQFVPATGPVCPRDGSCLSWTLSRPKCLRLLVFSCPMYFRHFLRDSFSFAVGGLTDMLVCSYWGPS